jgi:hypothetical protein
MEKPEPVIDLDEVLAPYAVSRPQWHPAPTPLSQRLPELGGAGDLAPGGLLA